MSSQPHGHVHYSLILPVPLVPSLLPLSLGRNPNIIEILWPALEHKEILKMHQSATRILEDLYVVALTQMKLGIHHLR